MAFYIKKSLKFTSFLNIKRAQFYIACKIGKSLNISKQNSMILQYKRNSLENRRNPKPILQIFLPYQENSKLFQGVIKKKVLLLYKNLSAIRLFCTMQAIQFDPKSKEVTIVKKPVPDQIGEKEVLVKVAYAGICGTDVHVIDGEFPVKEGPLIPGHEFCGTVAKIGNCINHVAVGDKVVIDPNVSCKVCDHCRSTNIHYCENGGLNAYMGFFRDGGWEQYCVVPDIYIFKLPESISLKQAVLCEPMACVTYTWSKIEPLPIGSKILILGAGIIGVLFMAVLHKYGHKKVIVSEPSVDRLNLAQKLKTGFTFLTPGQLMSAQKEMPKCVTFDLVIDCSGNIAAMEHAITLLDYGGRICLFGVSSRTKKMKLNPYFLFEKEISIFGILTNPHNFVNSIRMIESMGSRYIDYDKLGIKIFELKQHKEAIDNLRKGKIAKGVFKM